MAKRTVDLGPIRGLVAEALGLPGQRTFRVNAHSPQGSARLWLEKEQLGALAAAIEQLLTEVGTVRGFTRGEGARMEAFAGTPGIEFRIGRLTLGYDQGRDVVSLLAREALPEDEDEEQEPAPEADQVQLEATREQMHAFSKQAQGVVSAGRPRCPLCGTPLEGPTHFCPRSNGHAPLQSED